LVNKIIIFILKIYEIKNIIYIACNLLPLLWSSPFSYVHLYYSVDRILFSTMLYIHVVAGWYESQLQKVFLKLHIRDKNALSYSLFNVCLFFAH